MGRGSVAVLDVRSSELTVIVGEKGVNNTFLFKTMRTEPYDGYQNGAFFDVANLKESVLRALAAAEQVCGERIKTLYRRSGGVYQSNTSRTGDRVSQKTQDRSERAGYAI